MSHCLPTQATICCVTSGKIALPCLAEIRFPCKESVAAKARWPGYREDWTGKNSWRKCLAVPGPRETLSELYGPAVPFPTTCKALHQALESGGVG